MFSPEKRRLRGASLVVAGCSLTRGAEGQALALLSGGSDRTQGNGMALGQGNVRLDIRKRLFTERVVGHSALRVADLTEK